VSALPTKKAWQPESNGTHHHSTVEHRPATVAAKAAEDLTPTRLNLAQPEMNIALKVAEVIRCGAGGHADELPVTVEASGSQSKDDSGAANNVSLTIGAHLGVAEEDQPSFAGVGIAPHDSVASEFLQTARKCPEMAGSKGWDFARPVD
jgi:hypothetical protein